MERSYLIRYGLMGLVGRFSAGPDSAHERGQVVVIRSHRGTELGEILTEDTSRALANSSPADAAFILRAAGPDDHERARRADRERDDRYAACRRVFENGVWPLDLVDVEPLLDDRRTVLHYLGPHRLDVTGILAAFRNICDLDVMLQPVGRDVPDDELTDTESTDDGGQGCGESCGSGGCGSSAGGCSDCGVKKLLTSRR